MFKKKFFWYYMGIYGLFVPGALCCSSALCLLLLLFIVIIIIIIIYINVITNIIINYYYQHHYGYHYHSYRSNHHSPLKPLLLCACLLLNSIKPSLFALVFTNQTGSPIQIGTDWDLKKKTHPSSNWKTTGKYTN